MDRRMRKTRKAIFDAFIQLLSEKDFAHITVGEIIERADIGRATFYSHFETKDFLLKELCEELFCHIFDAVSKEKPAHSHIFECDSSDAVFLHLLKHLHKNDNNILKLLSSTNNELILGYFKENLKQLVASQTELLELKKSEKIPDSFRINHIASVFVETVRWWVANGMKESPETIAEYFYLSV